MKRVLEDDGVVVEVDIEVGQEIGGEEVGEVGGDREVIKGIGGEIEGDGVVDSGIVI